MYNLTEYNDNYSKISGRLWQYYRDEPFLNANGAINDFPVDHNNSALFKFTRNNGRKDVKIRGPLKHSSNFLRTLKLPLINCEINLVITWSARCFMIDAPIVCLEPTSAITDTTCKMHNANYYNN